MSWADEERDVTAWLGNELQNEAFSKLYAQKEKIAALKNPDFDYVWSFMQTSDHFYYMATKWLSDGDVHSYFNPYDSAYDAFINYMNVLSDFIMWRQRPQRRNNGRKKNLRHTNRIAKQPGSADPGCFSSIIPDRPTARNRQEYPPLPDATTDIS